MSAQATSGPERSRTIVVGAGLTGLVVARELAARGVAVTVVDRNLEAGGLARTFRYGDWSFDVGPHRLRRGGPELGRVLRSAVGDDVLTGIFHPGLHAFGKTRPLPIRGHLVRSLPLRAMLHRAWDLVHRERPGEDSYESEVVAAYGRTLYEEVFRRATERFLGTPAHRIDADWARLGLGEAEGDDGEVGLYPRRGIGAIAEGLAAQVRAVGGRIQLGQEVTAIDTAGNRVVAVVAGDERLSADAVVWTGPVTRALLLLGVAPPTGLRYVSTVIYNVALREPATLRHPWVCYTGEERFVRVSDPAAFSPASAPAGRGGLCVECTCREGDGMWEDPSQHVPQVLVGLALTGAIRSVRSVEAVCPERIPDTYPIYERGYREELRGAMSSLARWRNLVLAGRSGLFWCNRMDEAILHGLRVAAQLETARGGADGARPLGAAEGEAHA